MLICRGGGSRTDLAWFDSEALGRAVATFPLPVVVGIGHEQDFSVLDYVGWRAKTPTAAAQLLVQKVQETLQGLEDSLQGILHHAVRILSEAQKLQEERARRLNRAVGQYLSGARRDLLRLSRGLPRAVGLALGRERERLTQAEARLYRAGSRELKEARRRLGEHLARIMDGAGSLLKREAQRLSDRERRLHALDPRRVVERGYAILRREGDGVVTDPRQAPAGTGLLAELRGGVLRLLSRGSGGKDGGKEN